MPLCLDIANLDSGRRPRAAQAPKPSETLHNWGVCMSECDRAHGAVVPLASTRNQTHQLGAGQPADDLAFRRNVTQADQVMAGELDLEHSLPEPK